MIGWCLEVPLSWLKESEAGLWKIADWIEAEQWLLGGPLAKRLGINHNLCGCPRGHIWIALTMLA